MENKLPEFKNEDELVAWAKTPEGQAYFAALNEEMMRHAGAGQRGMIIVDTVETPEPPASTVTGSL